MEKKIRNIYTQNQDIHILNIFIPKRIPLWKAAAILNKFFLCVLNYSSIIDIIFSL